MVAITALARYSLLYMSSTAELAYPKKSHRKKVVLPKNSAHLAEFFGIMLGDGGINNSWQANITLNAVKDKGYSTYISKLCNDLFRVVPAIRKRKGKQAIVISLASTTIVDFLVEHGLPRGNKLKNGLCIPPWILRNKKYRIACVRGLVDTDGCIFVHKHKIGGRPYQNIGLCFTSYSPELLMQVATTLEDFSIIPHISGQGRNIYLYREDMIAKYLKIFGSSNKRIYSVYKKWRGARVV